MAVYCPNNGNTYGSLQLWIDAVRDVDLGSTAVAIVKDSEAFTQRLNIVGQWPNGLRIQADNAFNGVYDQQAITTLTFQSDESIVFSIASGQSPSNKKPIELTGFIFRHKGEGPRLTDNILNLDIDIHENFFESIGNESDTEWVGASNIDIITHEETVDINIEANVCYGAAREGIKVYNNLPPHSLPNVKVKNNIVYDASSERDGFSGIKVFGGCRAEIENNISLTKFKQTSNGFEYVDALVTSNSGNATDSAAEDIEITNEDDLFVAKDQKNFQVKSDSPYLVANPNLGSFVQTVVGRGTSYDATITFTDFNLIETTHVSAKIQPYNVNLIIGGSGEVEGYTRQASFMDGDVILADHGNLEFDQLARAFHESTGHNHDGTLAGGALIPKIGDQESGNLLEIDNLGVKGSVVSNDRSMAADSDRLLVTQQAAKGYADFKASGPELINTVNSTSNINFVDDTNLAKLANLPSVGAGYVPENPQDDLIYVRKNADWIEMPRSDWSEVTGKPYTLAGYGITDAISNTDTAYDSDRLDGQLPSYYTNIVSRLGYQPIEQGGGTNQGSNKIHIGWHVSDSSLQLQVDSTNFGGTWPITSNDAQAVGGVAASEVYSSVNPPPPGTSIPRLTVGGKNLAHFDDGYFLDNGRASEWILDGTGTLIKALGAYYDGTAWKATEDGRGAFISTVTNEGLNPVHLMYFTAETTDAVKDANVIPVEVVRVTKNYLSAKELKENEVSLEDKYLLQSDVVDNLTTSSSTQALSAGAGKTLNDSKLGKTEKAADSSLLNGYTTSYYGTNDTVPLRDGQGDLSCRLIRSSYPNDAFIGDTAAIMFRNEAASDNYNRATADKASVANWMRAKTSQKAVSYRHGNGSDWLVSRANSGTDPDLQIWSAAGDTIKLQPGFTTGDVITISSHNPSTGFLIENSIGGSMYVPDGTHYGIGDQLLLTKPGIVRIYFYDQVSCMVSFS